MRIYNPALGWFLSVDPMTKAFANLTPYQFAANSPISNIDLDGNEAENFIFYMKYLMFGINKMKVNNINSLIGEVQKQYYSINIVKPTKTVDDLKNKIATDINSIYGTDKGSFEFNSQKKAGQISKGDFIEINPGLKGANMFVKVADVVEYNNDKTGVDGHGREIQKSEQTVEKYPVSEIKPVNDNEGCIGVPIDEAQPTTTTKSLF